MLLEGHGRLRRNVHQNAHLARQGVSPAARAEVFDQTDLARSSKSNIYNRDILFIRDLLHGDFEDQAMPENCHVERFGKRFPLFGHTDYTPSC